MASTKTVSKGIRISNEAAEYYSDKPLNRMVEGLMVLLEQGKVEFDGENLKISGSDGVHTQFPMSEALSDIEGMVSLAAMSLEDAFEEVDRLLNEGKLKLLQGSMDVEMPGWANLMADTCHDLCIPVEKAAESACKALRKGEI